MASTASAFQGNRNLIPSVLHYNRIELATFGLASLVGVFEIQWQPRDRPCLGRSWTHLQAIGCGLLLPERLERIVALQAVAQKEK